MAKKNPLEEIRTSNIRNFSIIAHVDHGKSTLANCIIRKLAKHTMRSDSLQKKDSLKALCRFELEEQKGVTFKLNYVSLQYYSPKLDDFFTLNLIDTPGHIDFKHEVVLSLAVCEGAILLVDAMKGVQAQTLFYYSIAKELNLKILPVISKVDLPTSQIKLVKKQLAKLLNCSEEKILLVSSKTDYNINELLENIIKFIPSPS